MSLSPQALLRGLVQRARPSINFDSSNNDVAVRQFSYGELVTQPLVRKTHNLADEGSFYVANSAQSGIALTTYGTAFSATANFLNIFNNNPSGGPNVYLDYVALTAIAAGAQTTTLGFTALAVVIDQGNRQGATAGTVLTVNNPNLAYAQNNSNVTINAGGNATAASPAARTIVGIRDLRPSVSITVINVVGDMNLLTFGSVEGATGSITVANANIMPQALPPVIIPPQCSAVIYLWYPGTTAPSAATYAPEVGFWVR